MQSKLYVTDLIAKSSNAYHYLFDTQNIVHSIRPIHEHFQKLINVM